MPPKEITELKDAIRATHGCESLHVESVRIKEVFKGQTAWEGTVEVFALIDHPKAKRAFAWPCRSGDQNKIVSVLAIPPTDSPQDAVKVAIASKGQGVKKWLMSSDTDKIIEKASNWDNYPTPGA